MILGRRFVGRPASIWGVLAGNLLLVAPGDWSGRLAERILGALVVFSVLVGLLVRLPQGWIERLEGAELVLRFALMLGAGLLLILLRAVVYLSLPSAVYLTRRTLVVGTVGGSRRRFPVGELASLHIERRSGHRIEMMVIGTRSGEAWDVCPLDWRGAPQLFSVLRRRLESRVQKRRPE